MPLEDSILSKEKDGTINEDYCKWCYTDGEFTYTSLDEITAYIVEHMSSDTFPKEQVKAFCEKELPKLKHWKQN